jgi:hypothetical protein
MVSHSERGSRKNFRSQGEKLSYPAAIRGASAAASNRPAFDPFSSQMPAGV